MTIRLHPQKGLNPVLGICPGCGKENGEILLLGIINTKYRCRNCKLVHIGRPKHGKCADCGSSDFEREPIRDTERIPSSLCSKCAKEKAEFEEEVRKGGVYFRCKKCHSSGVIKADAAIPFRKHALETGTIKAINDPMGVEFDETSPCPACQKAD